MQHAQRTWTLDEGWDAFSAQQDQFRSGQGVHGDRQYVLVDGDGASSAMRLMPGYGAALFTSLLELFPTLEIRKAQPEQLEKSEEREGRGAREKAAAKGAKDNGKGRKAEAAAGGAAGTGASVTDTPRGRRNGALATAAIVAALTHLGARHARRACMKRVYARLTEDACAAYQDMHGSH
eukprot:6194398-Pleurochrysis_carterae.AAC.1